jgi:hypothetical protein
MGLFPWFFIWVCLLLVYTKATDFCMSILYPANLLKEFMISSSFLVKFLGSLRNRIISSANRHSLTSSFFIWIPFISFSCLIYLARNSKTILNKIAESRQPWLFLNLRGTVSVALHLEWCCLWVCYI